MILVSCLSISMGTVVRISREQKPLQAELGMRIGVLDRANVIAQWRGRFPYLEL